MHIYIYPGDLTGRLLESVMAVVWEAKHHITDNPFMASYGIRTSGQEKMSCFRAEQDIILLDPGKPSTVFSESICVDIGTLQIINSRFSLEEWLSKALDFLAVEL